MHRRSFLATLGAATAAAALRRPATAAAATLTPAIGPVGLQLYTVRADMERDMPATLEQVARIGYDEVEFAGYFGRSPEQVRAMLKSNGLTSPSVHTPIDLLRTSWAKTLDEAKTIGHTWVTIPWLAPEARPTTADGWKRLADELNRGAEQANAAGLRFGYHNHDFELAPVEGVVPLELLVSGTDPRRVDFEMDVYWVTKAGNDPLAWFAKHPGRWRMLHVKDATPAPERRMADAGQGTIDWRKIFAQRRAAGVQHLFVERDDAPDPIASARTSYTYLATLGR